jgi:hypothetical protein
MEMIKENELKNGRPKGTVKAVWQKREWQIKKKKKKKKIRGKSIKRQAKKIVKVLF